MALCNEWLSPRSWAWYECVAALDGADVAAACAGVEEEAEGAAEEGEAEKEKDGAGALFGAAAEEDGAAKLLPKGIEVLLLLLLPKDVAAPVAAPKGVKELVLLLPPPLPFAADDDAVGWADGEPKDCSGKASTPLRATLLRPVSRRPPTYKGRRSCRLCEGEAGCCGWRRCGGSGGGREALALGQAADAASGDE
jgi:hypothetical protein